MIMIDSFSFMGAEISPYDFFNVLGFFLLFAFNIFQRGKAFIGYNGTISKHNTQTKMPNFVAKKYAVIFVLSCVQFFSGVVMNILIGDIFNNGSDNYFGFAIFAPMIFMLFCKLFKLDAIGYLDAFTPAYALSLVSFKIGCFCAGCCSGADIGPTLYYPVSGNNQFPIQLLECFVACCIFVFLLYYRRKAPKGTMHAMYLILYSSTRFCTEFLRSEANAFLIFKWYHVWCLIGIAVGIAEFFILKKHYTELQKNQTA